MDGFLCHRPLCFPNVWIFLPTTRSATKTAPSMLFKTVLTTMMACQTSSPRVRKKTTMLRKNLRMDIAMGTGTGTDTDTDTGTELN